MDILMMVLVAVFICVGVALVVLLIELVKMIKTARTTITDTMAKVDPMLQNVTAMTDDIKPVVKKVDPLVDRVQLTIDAVNLEMMRVDEILEDVSQITDTASSATSAVDNITNAPIKAVNNMATRMRQSFAAKPASQESTQLGDSRDAVTKALDDFKAAQDGQPVEREEAASAPVAEPDVALQVDEPNLEGFEKIVADSESSDASPDAQAVPVEVVDDGAVSDQSAQKAE